MIIRFFFIFEYSIIFGVLNNGKNSFEEILIFIILFY